MRSLTRIHDVAFFTISYLVVATLFALQLRNWEFVFYIGVVVLIGLGTFVVYQYVNLTRGVLWTLSIWGLLHMLGGLMPSIPGWPIDGTKAVFYSMWIIPGFLKYDHVVHAYGFGIATWLCWQAVRGALTNQRARFGVLILCTFAGMGLGALNEVVEFIAVLTVPDTNVGGYTNTAWDLVFNTIGCAMAAVMIRYGGAFDVKIKEHRRRRARRKAVVS